MKLALIGYGKMGKLVGEIALERGHEITAIISSKNPDFESIKEADCCIEFTEPNSSVDNIKRCADYKKNIVVGTTGWYEKLDEVKQVVANAGIGLLYAPNFSIGVHLMMKILSFSAELMNHFEEYAVAGIEYHHKQKRDAPSGTAKMMAKLLESKIERLNDLQFTSVREGSIPGTHDLIFDSACDSITISHAAKNRKGFALGAVIAAEWLQGKSGIYTLEDVYGP